MNNKPTVAAFTLGCKVNHSDTESILRDFAACGFVIQGFDQTADVYIINTCTVTQASSKKSRQAISKARKKNPNALIVAYGCYSQVEPEALQNLADLVIGTSEKSNIVDIVASKLPTEAFVNANDSASFTFFNNYGERTRAYLKVQDGCDRFCSYCIVPLARGAVESRPLHEILAEGRELVKLGFKEIVLAGIQIAAYGNAEENGNLVTLMKRIHDIAGLQRLRLSSLDPNVINTQFLEAVHNMPKLCDHFHLSLQSGSDSILKQMNRHYTTSKYKQSVEALREILPQSTFTTDMIVGFPGETDNDFNASLKFAEEIGFFRIHVFSYSPKKGTPAAEFPNQIDSQVKELRNRVLRTTGDYLTKKFYENNIGKVYPVLFESKIESKTNGIWEGHTTNYLTVHVKAEAKLTNEIVPVRLLEFINGAAYGEICI